LFALSGRDPGGDVFDARDPHLRVPDSGMVAGAWYGVFVEEKNGHNICAKGGKLMKVNY
jgi:hypothetical protein